MDSQEFETKPEKKPEEKQKVLKMPLQCDITQFFEIDKKKRRSRYLVRPPPVDAQEVYDALPRTFFKYSEFCINPKPAYIEALTDEDVCEKIEKHIRKFIKTTEKYIGNHTDNPNLSYQPKIIMIGEHGSEGLCKLHYHGILSGLPNDALCHFLKLIRKYIGRAELKMIRHEERYREYMFKSYRDPELHETWGKHSYIIINYNIEK